MEKLWPQYTWKLASAQTIYLTFDDGPHPTITPEVLAILQQHQVSATFFCIGKNVVMYPETFATIQSHGHTIGNHTHNHKNGWYSENKTYLKNVLQASNVIPSKLFRPPYGRIKNKQAQYLIRKGYKIVMWSLLTGDFDIKATPETCFQNIVQNIKAGDIVVFHDSEKAYDRMIYALPKFLAYCKEQNWEVKHLPF